MKYTQHILPQLTTTVSNTIKDNPERSKMGVLNTSKVYDNSSMNAALHSTKEVKRSDDATRDEIHPNICDITNITNPFNPFNPLKTFIDHNTLKNIFHEYSPIGIVIIACFFISMWACR